MKKELPSIERVASLDRFGAKKAIIPLDVKGPWQRKKFWFQWILLLVFLLIPWIKINSNPLILLNIGERKFAFFGFLFFAHDAPLVFFIFAFAALLLIFVTSIWGRVWCGYACPQTVFIEQVYRKIETWIEGSPIERRKNLGKPLHFNLFLKRALKWILFFLVSSLFAHSFAAYFVGAESILSMISKSPQENWSAFLVVSSITLLLLFDFGWFREQFCIIMCPYGRFQSVFMDDNSLAIVYDEKRGEPRKGLASNKPQGDCVSCLRCVEVCPTGIDIRQGVQMECIACTACIDACDEIMTKVKKPKGLIRYDNVKSEPLQYFKPRNLILLGFLFALVAGFTFSVSSRKDVHISVLRAQETPYQVMPGGEILNHFKLHIKNQSARTMRLKLDISPNEVTLITQINPVVLGAHHDQTIHFFTQFESGQKSEADILVLDFESQIEIFRKTLPLLGPKK